MNGDRWVVRYPTGEWGVERSSRRASHLLFPCMDDALVTARTQARAAGGGDVVVQAADGQISLREQVVTDQVPAPRQPHRGSQQSSRDDYAWTVFA